MPKTKRHRFEVEWITISYRTLLRWGSLLLAVVAVAGAIWLVVRLEAQGELRSARRLVEKVERELGLARQAGKVDEQSLREVEQNVKLARERLGQGDAPGARAAAETGLERLRAGSQPREEGARLLRVEGKVEVKPVGSLDWRDGRVGLGLGPGDLVRTGSGSAVQIVNLDGSVITLRAETVMRVERSARDRSSGKTDVAVAVDSGELTVATSEIRTEGSQSVVQTADNVRASVDPNTVLGVGVDPAQGSSRFDVVTGRARVEARGEVVEMGPAERLRVSAAGLDRKRLPGTPQLYAPAQYKRLLLRDLEKSPIELEWEGIREARAYHVELSRTPLFTSLVQDFPQHPATFLSVGKLGIGRYYWRVAAIDRDGVTGSPSPGSIFQVSDAEPQGEPPPLEITTAQALGEGMFLFEGRTQPGVFVGLDDGEGLTTLQPSQSGSFRQVIRLNREGRQTVTFTARNSEGLESQVRQVVEVQFQ